MNTLLRIRFQQTISVAIACLLLVMAQAGRADATQSVILSPGDDIQAAVKANPEGTNFILTSGTYRMISIEPKNGDQFTGQTNTVLNGSQVLQFLPDPMRVGIWVANAIANSNVHGSCQKTHPLCGYVQDLFIDNRLQIPTDGIDALQGSYWYFDRQNNKVYLSVDPSGHTVELGMSTYAFFGSALNVRISNLIVEKYANAAQSGAVGGRSLGTGWLVENVESRWNHGRGISLGSGSQIINSFIHHNGQLGISLYGTSSKSINNEISWNNYAGYSTTWEAGGSKFWGTSNLLVKSNYVHDNLGPGLWTDTDNVGTIYQDNVVTNNRDGGIQHEVSYGAVILHNLVLGNGDVTTSWLWKAQIDVQNSSNVEVAGNIVEVPTEGGNGIVIINQNRGSGILGPWVSSANHVHDNTVIYQGPVGASGLADDTGGDLASGNLFDNNRYILQGGGIKHWAWKTLLDWRSFVDIGQDVHGTCCD